MVGRMTPVDPPHEAGHDVEREALFFAVLRERARPVDVPAPPALGVTDEETRRRVEEAETEILEWLDEAEEEGARILERARAEAARLRFEGHEQAEQLRQAAERAAAEARRDRERVLREAEVESARAQAEAAARASAALREAEEAAAERRFQAAEEAAALLADTRAAAERRLAAAEREADWLRAQADADARAARAHAEATVRSVQADVLALQGRLVELVESASTLLPALEAATRSLGEGAPTGELPAAEEHDEDEKALGRLLPAAPEDEDGGGHTPSAEVGSRPRLRPLGRLLRRG